jgi:hypothetical protein
MLNARWQIHVVGSFVRALTREPISDCEAIIESGIRADASPFKLVGAGPVAHDSLDGTFDSWFVTVGDGGPVSVPKSVSVFVRVAEAEWKEHIQEVGPEDARSLSEKELLISLKPIEIGQRPTVVRWTNLTRRCTRAQKARRVIAVVRGLYEC